MVLSHRAPVSLHSFCQPVVCPVLQDRRLVLQQLQRADMLECTLAEKFPASKRCVLLRVNDSGSTAASYHGYITL